MTNTSFSIEQFSLKGKVALITGASYGIGFAIAKSYAEAGATIVFNDINQDLVNKGIEAYREVGIEAHGYVCDVESLTSSLITLVLSAAFQCAK